MVPTGEKAESKESLRKEHVGRFREFLDKNYKKEIEKASLEGKPLVVDFVLLDKRSPTLAEHLLQKPDEMYEIVDEAISQIDLPSPVKIKFSKLLEAIDIRNLRANHIGRFISIEGVVRKASEIRPEIIHTEWQCPVCNEIMISERKGSFVFKPLDCACGNKRGFIELNKKMIDMRWAVIEEPFELTEGEKPSQVTIMLKDDLVSPEGRRLSDPGNRLKLTGVLKDVPKGKTSSAKLDFYMDVNYVEPIDIGWERVNINPEDEEKILEMSKDPKIYEKLIGSLAPSLYGMEEIKESIILQLFGGVPRKLKDGTHVRGDIHILIIGDPAAGKSQLLKLVPEIVPRGKYVSGKGTTAAGLCTTYESLIQLGDGRIARIGDIVEGEIRKGSKEIENGVFVPENPTKREVVSFEQKNLKIKKMGITQYFKIKAPKKLVRLTTETGREVTVTPENPIPILEDGEIAWRKAENLSGGEYITCPRILPQTKNIKSTLSYIDESSHILNAAELVTHLTEKIKEKSTIREFSMKHDINENCLYHSWKKDAQGGKPTIGKLKNMCLDCGLEPEEVFPSKIVLSQYNGHKLTLSKNLTEDLMYMAGLIGGDGNISHTEFGGYDIKFSNSENSMLDIFSDICEKQLGIRPRREESNDRVTNMRFSSKIFANLLDAFGIPSGRKSHKMHVSEELSLLPNNLLSAYLQGLFDTDGSVLSRQEGSSRVEFYTASERMVRGIQLLLLRFGIISRVRKRKPSISEIRGRKVISGEKFVLEISGLENIRLFESKIGFRLERKKNKLRETTKDKKYHTNRDFIPSIGNLMMEARKSLGISARDLYGYKNYTYEKGERKPTRNCLKRVVLKMKESGYNEKVEHLEKFSDSDVFWDKIKCVEIIENNNHEWVYDVTVDGEHSFGCNGIIIHNTATVSKDEQFMGGWVLEAGAMVLANKGLLSIDEFEKMSVEDQVAMHEALEQGCYDPSTEIILEDGSKTYIGDFVEGFVGEEKGDKIYKDISDKDIYILSSDFSQIKPSRVKAVGKHKDTLQRIVLTTGQEVKITPHHPVFVIREGRIVPIEAKHLKAGDYIPVPKRLSLSGKPQKLPEQEIPQDNKHKKITFPKRSSKELCEWIGLVIAEGNAEVNRKTRNGVCFSNTDEEIIKNYRRIVKELFSIEPYIQKRDSLSMIRLISKPLYDFVVSLGGRILDKPDKKKLPEWINNASNEEISYLLRGLFDGEGSINYEYGTINLSTTSRELAKQAQELLLRFEVFSGLYDDRSMKGKRKLKAYKLQISGKENIENFHKFIGFRGERRLRLERLLDKKTVSSVWNHVPNVIPAMESIRKSLKLSYDDVIGHELTTARKRDNITKDSLRRILERFESRVSEVESAIEKLSGPLNYDEYMKLREGLNISRSEIARKLGTSQQNLWYGKSVKGDIELIKRSKEVTRNILEGMLSQKRDVENLRFILDAPVEWIRVKSKETLKGEQWVYDVTMNPTGIFIGNGIICHNSVSIAKASIVATLPAKTSVLAGGNPKFSRFDPYMPISKQITITETLLSRFDLKFALRDIPQKENDTRIVDHVLKSREDDYESSKPIIEPEMIRKYVAYVRDKCKPVVTKETGKLLKNFYIKTRRRAEGGAAVPITLRQFEALMRLSEASAKIQLSDVVRKSDAQRAIRLMMFSLKQLGYDPETGQIDVDRSEGSTTFSDRSKIKMVLEIIKSMSLKKKEIPVGEIEEAAKKEGIDDVDDIIERLKRDGLLFEPTPGFVQKI